MSERPRQRRRRPTQTSSPKKKAATRKRNPATAKENDDRTTRRKQNAMVKAVEDTRGLIGLACRKAEISERTHRYWMAEDDNYRHRITSAIEVGHDMVEFRLLQRCDEGDVAALRTFLSARMKDRGYGVNRREQTGKNGGPIEINSNSPTIEELIGSTDPNELSSVVSKIRTNERDS